MRVLLATDGSKNASEAAEWLADEERHAAEIERQDRQNHAANRAIRRVVVSDVGHLEPQAEGRQEPGGEREGRARCEPVPARPDGRAQVVHEIQHRDDLAAPPGPGSRHVVDDVERRDDGADGP
jgi:hypothetical protein